MKRSKPKTTQAATVAKKANNIHKKSHTKECK